VVAEPPREAAHGDVTTNAALVLAGQAKAKPRELAVKLAERLEALDLVDEVHVAGPGFINMRLADTAWHAQLAHVLHAGTAYGDSTVGGGAPVNVEYVSANPTGPLHVGHGRGAVFGDALAALLEKTGYAVTREYYVNDAGAQVDSLARSLRARYLVALGLEDQATLDRMIATGAIEYGGDYLKPVAELLAERDGDKWVERDEGEWLPALRRFVTDEMMLLIREDLAALGVEQARFTSERALAEKGGVEEALKVLEGRGLIYEGVLDPPKGKVPDDWEPRRQTLFKATEFGDDVDRPLRKSDGTWTYFATDLAYHLDKYRRGFRTMIDVWGADHGGYVKRMKAGVKGLSGGEGDLDVKLCQMVNLTDRGQPVKMSKRAGTFVTLAEVIDAVGRDGVRFIMLTRKNDAHLDFDLTKVREQSRENPVFYVQYAHARACSVMRHAADLFDADALTPQALAEAPLTRLTDAAELDLIKGMAAWPRVVENAALAHEPHRVAYYLHDLAGRFHALWNKGKEDDDLRFIHADDAPLTLARLALVKGLALVIASGLRVFEVTPVEELR
jgi:arginyl-tRNA synthetase